MDFDFSDEQTQLKDSVDRLIADTYASLEARQALRKGALGFSADNWATFAELGLLGMPFSEDDGGFGGTSTDTMIVMEAIGRGLAVEPYLATVVLGGTALKLGGTAAQKANYIPSIVDGSLRLALAHTERQSRYDLADVVTSAKAGDGGFVINGKKGVVLNGDSAQLLVVSARTAGGPRDPAGITLFLVPADAKGVEVHAYDTQDGGRAADITFTGVSVCADAVLGERDQGHGLLERIVEYGIAAVAAEAVGSMEALHNLTVDYLKMRKQFGTTIGSFQSLQHRSVDMLLMLEQARSMAMYAAMMVESEDAVERANALSAVKVQINRSCRFVGQQSVQLHGGIGMTMEYIGAHHFKRLTTIENTFGDTSHHLARVTAAGGLIGGEA